MRINIKTIFTTVGFTLLLLLNINAQSLRSLVNEGVNLYKKDNFAEAEVNFKKGIETKPESFEANFNLGDAYYKQGRYDEAINAYKSALTQTGDNNLKAKVHHNIGNSLLKSQKIKESIESYKSALKLNPDDRETKYNLSYALSLLNNQDEQPQEQNQQQDNQDQNDQQDQNQNQNQDQQNDNQNQVQQNQPQDNQSQQDNLKQPDKNQMSKEQAERILDAIKHNEKDLQKELRKKPGQPVKTDKDW